MRIRIYACKPKKSLSTLVDMPDYHIHTTYGNHAAGEACERRRRVGLPTLKKIYTNEQFSCQPIYE